MVKIFGYGEDALTLWLLKHEAFRILEDFQDSSALLDCIVFYRPSFGRGGGEKSTEFGEFDAILASPENIYLIESKWDNLSEFNKPEIPIRKEQKIRHRIFSWYLLHWNKKHFNDWKSFEEKYSNEFQRVFLRRRIAPSGSLLARNLESILNIFQEHYGKSLSERNIKNVLLFFYNRNKSTPPVKTGKAFKLVKIDYSGEIQDNFIVIN